MSRTPHPNAWPFMTKLIDERVAARAELAALGAAEHPDVTDRFGRVWVWWSHDLYRHDGHLAFPLRMITDGGLGLPRPELADNPNYPNLCDICRRDWPKGEQ